MNYFLFNFKCCTFFAFKTVFYSDGLGRIKYCASTSYKTRNRMYSLFLSVIHYKLSAHALSAELVCDRDCSHGESCNRYGSDRSVDRWQ